MTTEEFVEKWKFRLGEFSLAAEFEEDTEDLIIQIRSDTLDFAARASMKYMKPKRGEVG